jgi:hypothetical protein
MRVSRRRFFPRVVGFAGFIETQYVCEQSRQRRVQPRLYEMLQ